MKKARSRSHLRALLAVAALSAALAAHAGSATYTFGNTFAANEAGAPSLTPVNPLGQNTFGTASIYGATRSVYNTSGTGTFAENAGLLLNAASFVTATQYSLEMVVSLQAVSGYRKLADVSGRASDGGYYVLDSTLNVYPVINGPQDISAGVYNYLVLTVSNNAVKGYVNGNLDFTTTTDVMNGNNFAFFLDDAAQGYEYSNVSVGLLRLSDGILTDADVRGRAPNPYQPVPEPTTMAALGLGAVAMLHRRRRA